MSRAPARKTLRDTMLANQSSMDMYAALYGRERVEVRDIPAPPKTRAPAQPRSVPLESEVLAEIVDGLLTHEMVGVVERINSGTAVEADAEGRKRFIAFNHVYRAKGQASPQMRASDLSVTLLGGHWGGRRLAVEAKRPGWTRPTDEREWQQLAYLKRIVECGGYAIFACSWHDVEKELTRIRCSPENSHSHDSHALDALGVRRVRAPSSDLF